MSKETLHLNPAKPADATKTEGVSLRRRIPMSTPRPKLAIPELPGFYCYWMNDYAGRIQQAQQSGYDFVSSEEIDINPTSISGDVETSGNSDLGTRVSVVVGEAPNGGPLRAYLMKLPSEFHNDDVRELQKQNERLDKVIKAGKLGAEADKPEDAAQRYVGRFSKSNR
jgi:hypothetical protein